MRKIQVATLGLVAVVVLAWAVPAFAHSNRAAATITVTEGKPTPFTLKLSTTSVKHGTVTFKVTNAGVGLPHDFTINGKKTAQLAPGKSASLTVTFKKAGKYAYSCTVPGHAAGGMKGTLKVT
jgi:uncharacterized cupredoxin-like copper-binding protein